MGWGKIFMWKCTNTYGERGKKTHSFLASMTYWVSKQHRCLWESLQLHEIDVQKRKKKKNICKNMTKHIWNVPYRPEFHWHLKSLVPHLVCFWIFTVHIYGNIKEKNNKKTIIWFYRVTKIMIVILIYSKTTIEFKI